MNTLLINMCFGDVKMKPDNRNFSASCRFCLNKSISGNMSSSSNFLNHIKVSYHC